MSVHGPFAHADQMVRALIFSDRYLRRRLVKSALVMTSAFAMIMVMPTLIQSQIFGGLDAEAAAIGSYLAQSFGGGMATFAFLWAGYQTENLARTAMGERLMLRPGERKNGLAKQIGKQMLFFVPAGGFYWWMGMEALGALFALMPLWLAPVQWLTHIQPADLPPGSTAKEDAVPQNTWGMLAKGMAFMNILLLAMAAGLLMAGVGIALTIPLAVGFMALIDGRMLRHDSFRQALRSAFRPLRGDRWTAGPLRLLWALGAPPLAIAQAMQSAMFLLLIVPMLAMVWTHGADAFTARHFVDATSMSLWTAPIALPILGLVSCLSAFVFQTQAIWFTRVQDELEEGTAIEGLLVRLEGEQAA